MKLYDKIVAQGDTWLGTWLGICMIFWLLGFATGAVVTIVLNYLLV